MKLFILNNSNMKHSSLLTATSIAIVYAVLRFIEMRYIMKENKPLKVLFRDTLLVYICVLIGIFILNQVAPLKDMIGSDPTVFTNNPDF